MFSRHNLPRLNVGDHVCVVNPQITYNDYEKGSTGVVRRIDDAGDIYVDWDKPFHDNPDDEAARISLLYREEVEVIP